MVMLLPLPPSPVKYTGAAGADGATVWLEAAAVWLADVVRLAGAAVRLADAPPAQVNKTADKRMTTAVTSGLVLRDIRYSFLVR
jgi:hypothetical protein